MPYLRLLLSVINPNTDISDWELRQQKSENSNWLPIDLMIYILSVAGKHSLSCEPPSTKFKLLATVSSMST